MTDNNIWYYKVLDLPELPDELKQQFDILIDQYLLEPPEIRYTKENRDQNNYINYLKIKRTKINEKISVPGGEVFYHALPPEFMEWFTTNISSTIEMPRFSVHRTEGPLTFLAAHVDLRRNYTLSYIHRPGGDRVKTVFYQEEGEPIIRGVDISTVNPTKPLIKLVEINIPANTWHLLRTDIIHSVEFMTSPRIRITSDPVQAEVDALDPYVIDILK